MLCLRKPNHILPSTTGVPGVLRRSRLNQQLHQQPLHPQASGLRLNDITTAFLVIQPAEGRSQVFLANSIINLLLHILLVLSLCNSNTDCLKFIAASRREVAIAKKQVLFCSQHQSTSITTSKSQLLPHWKPQTKEKFISQINHLPNN